MENKIPEYIKSVLDNFSMMPKYLIYVNKRTAKIIEKSGYKLQMCGVKVKKYLRKAYVVNLTELYKDNG